ncbi:hypothetical protein PG989_016409 [Apiospora arundinis]|uniref:Rhodopsin domain-containing protein n=1 Tax=Apiospora kogelbergensis TaxID=1337665 RepID=A0AAW0QZA7_9PEZI
MDAFTIEAFALLGIGLAVIGLRTYWRLSTVGIRNLKADDYLMLLAAVVYSAETYLAYSVGKLWHGLANNGMTDDERRLLDPSSEEYRLRVGGSKTQIAGWSTYTFLLWVLKAAMCTFYIRLTDGLNLLMRIYVGFALITSTWIAAACAPTGSYFMDITTNQDADFCQPAISKVDIFVTVVLNVVTDLYLLTIPIPMLWQSSIKPVKKAALIVMFSGGVFVTAAGVLRCVLIITNPVTGAQQAGSWAVRETFVAVITTNLPLVFPMFRIWLYPIAGTVRQYSSRALSHPSKDSRSGITGGSTKPQQPGGAFSLDDRNPRRGKGVRSVDHITGLTFSESEERLYDQNRSPTGKVPVSAETRRYSTQYPSV